MLALPGVRRLLSVRLAGQFGDGVFQASLAGAVLFDPEHQARPADIAAGFAVLLLPYSVIGPFAGVLLDRWWRQRVLNLANVVRAGAVLVVAAEIAAGVGGAVFYASALVVISLSRFVLSALSAALPRLVAPSELVTANAITATAGTLAASVGGGVAIGARWLLGDTDLDYAVIATAAAALYLLAAGAASGFARTVLGPTADERRGRENVVQITRGLHAGLKHIGEVAPVRDGLAMIGLHRLGYGVTTVCTLLLFRNYFHGSAAGGALRSGLGGLGQVLAAVALGGAVAALTTPVAFRRFGAVRWPAALLLVAALVQVALVLPFALGTVLLAALLLGYIAQSIKISVDTLVQQLIADAFRGRTFALYDMLFNVALVIAAVLTASVLPASGHSPAAVLVISAGYALTAITYLTTGRPAAAAARTTA